MQKIRFALLLGGVLVLSGCQQINGLLAKRDNGSLDYAKAQKLDPIALPVDQASADFVPLYETPDAPVDFTPSKNATGKQFALPKPPQTLN